MSTNALISIDGEIPTKANILSTEHRDGILKFSRAIAAVETHEHLEVAVDALGSLNKILKEYDAGRLESTKRARDLVDSINTMVATFLLPVQKEKDRISGMANHYQTLQFRQNQERESAALREKLKAEADARAAEEAAKKATNEKQRLAAELAQETANLRIQEAQDQLSVPTNTPKGMTTRARWDFEIVAPNVFRKAAPAFCFAWNSEEEYFRIARADIIKLLNGDNGHTWLPEEGASIIHENLGIRIFRSVNVSVRS